MGAVKMPGVLSPELIKALAGNVYTVEDEQEQKEDSDTTWKEYFKAYTKRSKKEAKKCEPGDLAGEIDVCCPKKVKFIFILNNAVVINVNAIAEEEQKHR